VLVCALASATGCLVPYALARRFGPTVAHRFARWIDVDPKQVDVWTARIARHGFRAVLIGRLVPGARVAMSVIAGTAQVPPFVFASAVFIAATLYWSLWVAIGVIFGPAVRQVIGPAYIRYVLIGLPIFFVGYLVFRHLRGRSRRAAAERAQVSGR
jgi:membrane protein DedA with SNARE-associated domain